MPVTNVHQELCGRFYATCVCRRLNSTVTAVSTSLSKVWRYVANFNVQAEADCESGGLLVHRPMVFLILLHLHGFLPMIRFHEATLDIACGSVSLRLHHQ